MKMNINRLISIVMYVLAIVFFLLSGDVQTSILLTLWVIVPSIWSIDTHASMDNKNDN